MKIRRNRPLDSRHSRALGAETHFHRLEIEPRQIGEHSIPIPSSSDARASDGQNADREASEIVAPRCRNVDQATAMRVR